MAAKTWSAAIQDSNFSDALAWNGGIVPHTTDSITFDSTSVMNCIIDNLGDWAGGTITIAATYSGTITLGSSQQLQPTTFSQAAGTLASQSGAGILAAGAVSVTGGTFNNGGYLTCNDNLTFGAGMTYTDSGGSVSVSRAAAGTSTIETLGKLSTTIAISASGTGPSTIQLAAATVVTIATGGGGSGGVEMTLSVLGTARVTTSATWTMTGSITLASGVIWAGLTTLTLTEGSLTVNSGATWPANVNVTMTLTTATARTFAGGGKTYGTFTRSGAGANVLTFTGSNTFTTFTDSATANHTLRFTAGTTQTGSSFVFDGKSFATITIDSTSAGSAATLHCTGGAVSATFMSIKDSTVDVSPTWTATNSTNVSGNTNWLFATPAAGGGGRGVHQMSHQPAITAVAEEGE